MADNKCSNRIQLTSKTQMFLIVLCWAVYTVAYFGRYSYTSNVVPIQKYYGVGKDEFALATTFFFFAYGAGQLINGILCRRYNMKFMIFGSLAISAVINAAVFFGLPFIYIKYVWLVNGLCQSILWASLIRILSCYLDVKHMKTAVIFMSTTVSAGTLVIYGASALFALFDGFKYSFLLAAVCMVIISAIWFIYFPVITKNARLENAPVRKDSDNAGADAESNENPDGNISVNASDNSKNKNVFLNAFFWIVTLFSLFAILTNYAKDGLTTWIPQILKEQYDLTDSLSIILTLVLPVFGVCGALFAVFFNKVIKNFTDLLGIFFTLAALSIFGIVLLFKTDYWYFVLILFGIINMFMHGANNVITSMFPLSVGEKHNAGLLAGVLNGACYIGSTLSQYLIAMIASAGGWGSVMNVLLYSCIGMSALAFILFVVRQTAARKKFGSIGKDL